VVSRLENMKAENHDYRNYFIKKVLNHFGLKNYKKYISQEDYKNGDITAIFKTIEYDSLNKELKINNSLSKKISKL
jgi:hypothetical protein